jgi:predicted Zn-dependent protease with MMP-like domain
VIDMPVEQFEELVTDAIDEIPTELRGAMDNVAIVVDDSSPPGRLLGLYEGVPLTKRGTYSGSMPDRITIFMATICAVSGSTQEVVDTVRKTVLHEVGHYFGLGEQRLHELGWG